MINDPSTPVRCWIVRQSHTLWAQIAEVPYSRNKDPWCRRLLVKSLGLLKSVCKLAVTFMNSKNSRLLFTLAPHHSDLMMMIRNVKTLSAFTTSVMNYKHWPNCCLYIEPRNHQLISTHSFIQTISISLMPFHESSAECGCQRHNDTQRIRSRVWPCSRAEQHCTFDAISLLPVVSYIAVQLLQYWYRITAHLKT